MLLLNLQTGAQPTKSTRTAAAPSKRPAAGGIWALSPCAGSGSSAVGAALAYRGPQHGGSQLGQ